MNRLKSIFLILLFCLASASVYAGSKTRIQWLYGLPADNKLWLNDTQYAVGVASNSRVEISTNTKIQGVLSITGYVNVKTALDAVATSSNTETTARINGDLSLGQSTATLQSNINASNASTGTLRNELCASTGTQLSRIIAIETSTGSLRDEMIVSTANLVTSDAAEVTNRTSADLALGIATSTLQGNIDTLAASTAPVAQVATIQADTGTLRTDVNAVIVSTGGLVKKSGDTMTGNLDATGYEIKAATVSIGQLMILAPSASDPADIRLSTGGTPSTIFPVWATQDGLLHTCTGWIGANPIKSVIQIAP